MLTAYANTYTHTHIHTQSNQYRNLNQATASTAQSLEGEEYGITAIATISADQPLPHEQEFEKQLKNSVFVQRWSINPEKRDIPIATIEVAQPTVREVYHFKAFIATTQGK